MVKVYNIFNLCQLKPQIMRYEERGTLLPNVGLDGCIVVYGLK